MVEFVVMFIIVLMGHDEHQSKLCSLCICYSNVIRDFLWHPFAFKSVIAIITLDNQIYSFYNIPFSFSFSKDLQLSKWSKEPTHISKSIYSPFFSFVYCLYLCFVYNHSLCILYTYYIISLCMLIHIVSNCIQEKTSSVGKTRVRSLFVIFSK